VAAALSRKARPRSAIVFAAALVIITAAIVVWLLTLRRPELANAPGTMRPVWNDPDADIYGRVSPDGRSLSFIDWSTREVAIREVETGKTRQITQKPRNAVSGPGGSLFSPDASRLAYTWRD